MCYLQYSRLFPRKQTSEDRYTPNVIVEVASSSSSIMVNKRDMPYEGEMFLTSDCLKHVNTIFPTSLTMNNSPDQKARLGVYINTCDTVLLVDM